MTDLRALLHEPWCRKCGGPSPGDQHRGPSGKMVQSCGHGVAGPRGKQRHCLPLATRMPRAVPPGLEWTGAQFVLRTTPDGLGVTGCSRERAEIMFIGHNAKKHPAQVVHVLVHYAQAERAYADIPAALAAALHRLADEEEAAS